MIKDVLINDLKIINVEGGNVMHSLKHDDEGFKSFAECYFSFINYKFIKGWKKHKEVTLNLTVPIGQVKFVIFDSRKKSETYRKFQEVVLGLENFKRLTVPPMVWVAFQGLNTNQSLIMNVINYKHDPYETENKNIDFFSYNWSNSL